MKKALSLLICIVLVFTLVGCVTNKGGGLTDDDQDLIEETFEFEHFYFQSFDEYKLYQEEIQKEVLVAEEKLPEGFSNETIVTELVVSEDFSEKLYIPSDLAGFDIDWGKVIANFAIGTSIVLITGVLTVATMATPIGYVFAKSFSESIKQGVIGATIGAISAAVTATVNGKTSGEVFKVALETASSGFLIGAVTGAVTGGLMGRKAYLADKKLNNTYSIAKGELTKGGKAVGSVTKIDDVTYAREGKQVFRVNDKGEMIDDVADLFPDVTSISRKGSPLTVKDNVVYNAKGDKIVGYKTKIGDIVDDNGDLLYTLRKTNSGSVTVNDSFVKARKKIDFTKSDRPKVNISENNTTFPLKNGKAGSAEYVKNADEVSHIWLKDDKGKIFAKLDKEGNMISGWETQLDKARGLAVQKQNSNVIDLIKRDIPDKELRQFFHLKGTKDEVGIKLAEIKKYVKQYGRLPKGYQGHHMNNVANHPELAGVAHNIKFYSAADHLSAGHHGNFQNPSEVTAIVLEGLLKILQKYAL